MKTYRLAIVGALLIVDLTGCTEPAPAPFSTPQTEADRLPADVKFPEEAAFDPASIRFVGANGSRRYYLAQTDDPPSGVCLLIADQSQPRESISACGGSSGVEVSSATLGDARYAAARFLNEMPTGWTALSDAVIVRPPG